MESRGGKNKLTLPAQPSHTTPTPTPPSKKRLRSLHKTRSVYPQCVYPNTSELFFSRLFQSKPPKNEREGIEALSEREEALSLRKCVCGRARMNTYKACPTRAPGHQSQDVAPVPSTPLSRSGGSPPTQRRITQTLSPPPVVPPVSSVLRLCTHGGSLRTSPLCPVCGGEKGFNSSSPRRRAGPSCPSRRGSRCAAGTGRGPWRGPASSRGSG